MTALTSDQHPVTSTLTEEKTSQEIRLLVEDLVRSICKKNAAVNDTSKEMTPRRSKRKIPDPTCVDSSGRRKKKRKKKQKKKKHATMALLTEAVKRNGGKKELVKKWGIECGMYASPDGGKFSTLKEALQKLNLSISKRNNKALSVEISREDIYYLSIMRRKIIEQQLPLVDGPVSVLRLGTILPKPGFFSMKRLFPIGYCARSIYHRSDDKPIPLLCGIESENNNEAPVFVVRPVRNPEVIFQSSIAGKAWSKAIDYIQELDEEGVAELIDINCLVLESSKKEDTDVESLLNTAVRIPFTVIMQKKEINVTTSKDDGGSDSSLENVGIVIRVIVAEDEHEDSKNGTASSKFVVKLKNNDEEILLTKEEVVQYQAVQNRTGHTSNMKIQHLEKSEDGFGLLRRNVCRVLEGLPKVLQCEGYRFWEERHICSHEVHEKQRLRLSTQLLKLNLTVNQREAATSSHATCTRGVGNAYNEDEGEDDEDEDDTATEEEEEKNKNQEEESRRLEKANIREEAKKIREEELVELDMLAIERAKELQLKEQEKELEKKKKIALKEEIRKKKDAEKEMRRLMKLEERKIQAQERERSLQLKLKEIEAIQRRKEAEQDEHNIVTFGITLTTTSTCIVNEDANRNRKEQISKEEILYEQQKLTRQKETLLRFLQDEELRREQWMKQVQERQQQQHIYEKVKKQIDQQDMLSVAVNTNFMDNVPDIGLVDICSILNLSNQDDYDVEAKEQICRNVIFVWDFCCSFADYLMLCDFPNLHEFSRQLSLTDGSSGCGDGIIKTECHGRFVASLHIVLIRLLWREYYNLLGINSTSVSEFEKTRPITWLTWPESARQVMLLALEAQNEVMLDERIIKHLKGLKNTTSKDDAFLLPLRKLLVKRGIDIKNGKRPLTDETGNGDERKDEDNNVKQSDIKMEEGKINRNPSGIYGVLLNVKENFPFTVQQQEKHLRVASLNEEIEKISVGDFVLFINGSLVAHLSEAEFADFLSCSNVCGVVLSKLHPPSYKHVKPVVEKELKCTFTDNGAEDNGEKEDAHLRLLEKENALKLKKCSFVLKLIRAKESATPFNQPVSAELYPDYYTSGIISQPMDLGTIYDKIQEGDYDELGVEAFVKDVELVWSNCYMYNTEQADISQLAMKLAATFRRLMTEFVCSNSGGKGRCLEEDCCRNCWSIHCQDQLLLCDRCDAAYHTFCLNPPLIYIPQEEWYCPVCTTDPKFSHEEKQKKVQLLNNTKATTKAKDDKKKDENIEPWGYVGLQRAVFLLSQPSYSSLNLGERCFILRCLCELLQDSTLFQSNTSVLEESCLEMRQSLTDDGVTLSDVKRDWSKFDFVEDDEEEITQITSQLIINGVACPLSLDLISYLTNRLQCELQHKCWSRLPSTPPSSLLSCCDPLIFGICMFHPLMKTVLNPKIYYVERNMGGNESDNLEDEGDEEEDIQALLFEEFGNDLLHTPSCYEKKIMPTEVATMLCNCCDDDLKLAPSCSCMKWVNPADRSISYNPVVSDFQPPKLMQKSDFLRITVFNLKDTTYTLKEWFTLRTKHLDFYIDSIVTPSQYDYQVGDLVYAINDQYLFGWDPSKVEEYLRHQSIVHVYTASSASNSLDFLGLVDVVALNDISSLQINDTFVEKVHQGGEAEFSGRIRPLDAIYAIHKNGNQNIFLCVVRNLAEEDYITARSEYLTKLKQQHAHITTKNKCKKNLYEVVFQKGPIGLALALSSNKIVVRSLNDNSDGTPGQASLCGRIMSKDIVELVNHKTYGPVKDLSEFTNYLLSLPRPVTLTFSRDRQMNCDATIKDDDHTLKFLGHVNLEEEKVVELKGRSLPFTCIVYGQNRWLRINSLLENENPMLKIGDILLAINNTCLISPQNAEAILEQEVMTSSLPLVLKVGKIEVERNDVSNLVYKPMDEKSCLVYVHERCLSTWRKAQERGLFLQKEMQRLGRWEFILEKYVVKKSFHQQGFHHFFGQQGMLVINKAGQWLCTRDHQQIESILSYLDKNAVELSRELRCSFAHILAKSTNSIKTDSSAIVSLSTCLQMLEKTPLALETSFVEGSGNRFHTGISYFGRHYYIGTFTNAIEAKQAVAKAKQNVLATGCHLDTNRSFFTCKVAPSFPWCSVPTIVAEKMSKRFISKRYDHQQYYSKSTKISSAILQQIRQGLTTSTVCEIDIFLPAPKTPPPPPLPPMPMATTISQPSVFGGNITSKKKQMEASTLYNRSMYNSALPHGVEGDGKRGGDDSRMYEDFTTTSRKYLSLWEVYKNTPTPMVGNSFLNCSRTLFDTLDVLMDRRLRLQHHKPIPDVHFRALYHGYLVAYFCTLLTKAIVQGNRVSNDESIVALLMESYSTAFLNMCDCMNSTEIKEKMSIAAFLQLAWECLMKSAMYSLNMQCLLKTISCFFTESQYFSHDELTLYSNAKTASNKQTISLLSPKLKVGFCRTLTCLKSSLPADFKSHLEKLSNYKVRYDRNSNLNLGTANPNLYNNKSGLLLQESISTSSATSGNSISKKKRKYSVRFNPGPLGIVISHSEENVVSVTRFSEESPGRMGQAEKNGKISLGDVIVAVNNQSLKTIGLDGFRRLVSSAQQPLKITFETVFSIADKKQQQKVNSSKKPATCSVNNVSNSQVQQSSIVNSASDGKSANVSIYGNGNPTSYPVTNSYISASSSSATVKAAYQSTNFYQQPNNIQFYQQDPTTAYNNLCNARSMDMSTNSIPLPLPTIQLQQYQQPDSNSGMQLDDSLYSTNWAFPTLSDYPVTSATNTNHNGSDGEMMSLLVNSVNNVNNEVSTGSNLTSSLYEMSTNTNTDIANSQSLQMMNDNDMGFLNFGSTSGDDKSSNIDNSSYQPMEYYEKNTVYRTVDSIVFVPNKDGHEFAAGCKTPEAENTVPSSRRSNRKSRPVNSFNSKIEGNNDSGSTERNSTTSLLDPNQPTGGEQGELATDGLEQYMDNIWRPFSAHTLARHEEITLEIEKLESNPSRMKRLTEQKLLIEQSFFRLSKGRCSSGVVYVRNQLLLMEASLPREAFRAGLWPETLRLAWAESVYSCDSVVVLMKMLCLLENSLENDFLKPMWRQTPLPAAKTLLRHDAITSVSKRITLASVAMRCTALDRCGVIYMKPKKSYYKRKYEDPSDSFDMLHYRYNTVSCYHVYHLEDQEDTEKAIIPNSNQTGSAASGAYGNTSGIAVPTNLKCVAFAGLSRSVLDWARQRVEEIIIRGGSVPKLIEKKKELVKMTQMSMQQIEEWIDLSVKVLQITKPTVLTNLEKAKLETAVSMSVVSEETNDDDNYNDPNKLNTTSSIVNNTPVVSSIVSKKKSPLCVTKTSSRKRKLNKDVGSKRRIKASKIEPNKAKHRKYIAKIPGYPFPCPVKDDSTLQSRLLLILSHLKKNPMSFAFREPLRVEEIPGYTEIIARPMDLETVESKLRKQKYLKQPKKFVTDINLIWSNCLRFNLPESDISISARRLKCIFDRLFEELISSVKPGTTVGGLLDEEQCRVCRKATPADSMLMCDCCDGAYHIFCLSPPIPRIPSGDWFCSKCLLI